MFAKKQGSGNDRGGYGDFLEWEERLEGDQVRRAGYLSDGRQGVRCKG